MKVNYTDTIEKSTSEVFEAIVQTKHLSNYFISSASAKLKEGERVQWNFDDVSASLEVSVKSIIKDKLISFEWIATGEKTLVEIKLDANNNDFTKIDITETGLANDENGTAKAIQQSIGWTHFFCCLKAYLLFNVNLRTGKRIE